MFICSIKYLFLIKWLFISKPDQRWITQRQSHAFPFNWQHILFCSILVRRHQFPFSVKQLELCLYLLFVFHFCPWHSVLCRSMERNGIHKYLQMLNGMQTFGAYENVITNNNDRTRGKHTTFSLKCRFQTVSDCDMTRLDVSKHATSTRHCSVK